jgi:hypothetical protein
MTQTEIQIESTEPIFSKVEVYVSILSSAAATFLLLHFFLPKVDAFYSAPLGAFVGVVALFIKAKNEGKIK